MAEGGTVELEKVLLVADGDKVSIGNPMVAGAKVKATARENGKAEKVIVFKYKPKVRYRRRNGHRQLYTRLSIDSITAPGMAKPKAEKPVKAVTKARAAKETKPAKATSAAKPARATKTTAKRTVTRTKKKEETANGA